MDKVLKRPLFQKKAMEAYKAKHGGKVPGYFVGALVQGTRALAVPAYRYLAPRAASFFARPGVQTGLTGLEAYGIGVGSREMAEGISEGDTGKFLTGASFALPGMAFLPSTARRSGIAALRETGEYLAPRATDLTQKILASPGKSAIGFTGLGLTGQVLSPDQAEAMQAPAGMTDEQYNKDIQDRLIYSKPVYSDEIVDETVTGPTVLKGPRAIGIKDPKTKGEETFNAQIQIANKISDVAEKLGVTDIGKLTDQKIKQIAIESNVDEPTVRSMMGKPMKQPEVQGPPMAGDPIASTQNITNNISGMTDNEVNNLVNSRKKELQGAKEASSLSSEFQAFKNKLSELTGSTNDNLNNLVAMKVASQLLTGKTSERGFKGFLDVAGQGLGVFADSTLALTMAQREQDLQLAQAFLKSKADEGKAPALVAGDKVFKIEDPNYPGNYYNVKGILGQDGRQYYRDIDNVVKPVPAGQVGYETKENQDKINLYSANLEENKRGQEMIEEVLRILPDEGPLNAAFNLVKEDAYGTIEQVMGKNRLDSTSDFDTEIRGLLSKNDGSEKGMKASEKLINNYDKELEKIEDRAVEIYREAEGKGFLSRPSEEQLRKYAKLALIEQRMKYIVANANKTEDRLTQKDIDNAEKNTKIIQFIGSAGKVKANYKELQNEFKKKAQGFAMQYRNAGGTESSMEYFKNTVPGVKEMYDAKLNKTLEQMKISNAQSRANILSTIPTVGGQ